MAFPGTGQSFPADDSPLEIKKGLDDLDNTVTSTGSQAVSYSNCCYCDGSHEFISAVTVRRRLRSAGMRARQHYIEPILFLRRRDHRLRWAATHCRQWRL